MGRISLAVRAFFAALSGSLTAEGLAVALDAEKLAERSSDRTPVTREAPQPQPGATGQSVAAGRSEALTLLAALQREARFLDLVQEPLADYTDQQIGAAARDVLRDCRTVIDRMFQLQPVVDRPEDSDYETPAEFSTGRFRLSGAVQGEAPYTGKLIHPGWQASQCELPKWTGSQDDRWIVAPAEIEVR